MLCVCVCVAPYYFKDEFLLEILFDVVLAFGSFVWFGKAVWRFKRMTVYLKHERKQKQKKN